MKNINKKTPHAHTGILETDGGLKRPSQRKFFSRKIFRSPECLCVRAGFTFVETLIVVAVTVTIGTIVTMSLLKQSKYQNLKLTVSEVVAVMNNVQQRSISEQDGKTWGMRFANGGGSHAYHIFSGQSFDSNAVERSYELRRGVQFSKPWVSSTYDIIFNPITGWVSEEKVITLFMRAGNSSWAIDIRVSPLGKITSETSEGIFGYWHVDEETGTVIHDSSGINSINDQIPPDPLVWHEGGCKRGACLEFNGYHTNGTTTYQNLTELTVESWVKLTADGNYGGVWSGLSGGSEYVDMCFDGATRRPRFRTGVAGGSLNANSALNLNEWYHLAYVYDGSARRIYINGAEDASNTLSGATFAFDNWEMGRSEEKSTQLLYGVIDELKVYNRALSATEIENHYNQIK